MGTKGQKVRGIDLSKIIIDNLTGITERDRARQMTLTIKAVIIITVTLHPERSASIAVAQEQQNPDDGIYELIAFEQTETSDHVKQIYPGQIFRNITWIMNDTRKDQTG